MRHPRAIVAALVLLLIIPTANALTSHYGMVPVFPGLEATAGTYLVGFVFVLRDVIHRAAGAWPTVGVIAAAGAVSYLIAAPAIATASAAAFVVSELADLLVFSRMQRRGLLVAVLSSNGVGIVVDTFVFLPIAGFPVTTTVVLGQLVGKAWATLVVVPYLLERRP
jgi:hypothetical protein